MNRCARAPFLPPNCDPGERARCCLCSRHVTAETAGPQFEAAWLCEPTQFHTRGWSAPTGFVGAWRPQKFLNVRLNQVKPNIPVKLLAPLV
jgi:hypothetical protein